MLLLGKNDQKCSDVAYDFSHDYIFGRIPIFFCSLRKLKSDAVTLFAIYVKCSVTDWPKGLVLNNELPKLLKSCIL